MASDQSAAATKEDIHLMMEQMGQYYMKTEQHMDQWKEELVDQMSVWKEEMKHHFDVVAENIKHDFQHGAIADKVAQHDDDIRLIKGHLGLRSA